MRANPRWTALSNGDAAVLCCCTQREARWLRCTSVAVEVGVSPLWSSAASIITLIGLAQLGLAGRAGLLGPVDRDAGSHGVGETLPRDCLISSSSLTCRRPSASA